MGVQDVDWLKWLRDYHCSCQLEASEPLRRHSPFTHLFWTQNKRSVWVQAVRRRLSKAFPSVWDCTDVHMQPPTLLSPRLACLAQIINALLNTYYICPSILYQRVVEECNWVHLFKYNTYNIEVLALKYFHFSNALYFYSTTFSKPIFYFSLNYSYIDKLRYYLFCTFRLLEQYYCI